MAKSAIVVQVGIFPPGEPGTSVRLSFSPEVHPSVLALEIGTAVAKALRRKRNKLSEETATA